MSVPKGWVETTLDEIGRWGSGGTPKASVSSYYNGSIPWIRSGDLPDGEIIRHEATITEAGLASSSAKWVEPNSVLIAMYGATIGKVGITTYPVTTNQAIAFVKPYDSINPRYIFSYLRARRSDFIELGQGGAQPNISQEIIKKQPLPLPPVAEQRRIVAKLDALFARLARARAELDRSIALCAQLRSQVFDSAISGQLVRTSGDLSWSGADKHAIEERRLTYLAARKGSRLRSDLESTVDFMSGERAGWLSCRLADVMSLRVGHAFKSSQFSALGIRLLRGANVSPERVDWTDTVWLPIEDAEDYSEFVLNEGDIVIAMDRPVISSGLKIAQISAEDAGSLLVQRVANPRPSDFIENDYLTLILKSHLFKDQIEDHATGSDLPHISGNDILTTPCPLAPLELQRKIVESAKRALSHIDRLEAEAARARALLDRLEAAILTKAFKGELVPQDPNDEPASVLLERIRAQRAAAAPASKTKRGRRLSSLAG